MKEILRAFRDALVADATLLTLVPAANIYAGLRDEKTDIPAIDVFLIPAPDEPYAGAMVGGLTNAGLVVQVSTFAATESEAWDIVGRVQVIILGDNSTLNTAGVKSRTMIGSGGSMREANISHIPMRVRCNYHYKIA